MKYKVGDTLKHHRCAESGCRYEGLEFVVTMVDEAVGCYVGGAGSWYFEEDEVELVKEGEHA